LVVSLIHGTAGALYLFALSFRHVLILVVIKGGENMVTSSDVNFTEKEKHSNFTGGV
jgi:menaquinone-dependent protoporphyrinogen IX oxidase